MRPFSSVENNRFFPETRRSKALSLGELQRVSTGLSGQTRYRELLIARPPPPRGNPPPPPPAGRNLPPTPLGHPPRSPGSLLPRDLGAPAVLLHPLLEERGARR